MSIQGKIHHPARMTCKLKALEMMQDFNSVYPHLKLFHCSASGTSHSTPLPGPSHFSSAPTLDPAQAPTGGLELMILQLETDIDTQKHQFVT